MAVKDWQLFNFEAALADPQLWCCSGRCKDTNWGGYDRLHTRDETCPEFNKAELEGYIHNWKIQKKAQND